MRNLLTLLIFLSVSPLVISLTYGCESNDSKSPNTAEVLSQNVGDTNNSHVDSMEQLNQSEKCSDTISFNMKIFDWTADELTEHKNRQSVPFKVTSQIMTDTSLIITLGGVQNRALYFGNACVDGQNVNLYYWSERGVAAYVNLELYYEIRIPDKANYTVNIERLTK